MNADLNNAVAIIASARQAERLPDVLLQLNKDFQRAGLPPLTKGIASEVTESDADLARLLQERLYQLLMENFDGYLNLMYSVDVPQRIFRELRITDAVEVARQMATAILVREWQKVRMRAGLEPGM